MTYPDYAMCPHCRRADLSVELERDNRGDCPYCGKPLTEDMRRTCCIPKCNGSVFVTRELPVCDDCGVKIALFHAADAAKWDALALERRRRAEEYEDSVKKRRASTSVVYYVRLDEGRIKIGYTSRLKERLSGLRIHPSALLAFEPGGREVEKARHEQFAAERITPRLEDFAPTPRLLSWIEQLRTENPLPHWATLPDTATVTRRTK